MIGLPYLDRPFLRATGGPIKQGLRYAEFVTS